MYGTSLNSVLWQPGRTKDFHSVHGNRTDTRSFPGSSATPRNELPSTPCRGRLSCPRAVIVNSYEISGHSEQTSPEGTLFPNIHAHHLLVQWLKIFTEPEITEAPEKLEVLDPAEVSLCVQTSYKCIHFFCARKHKIHAKFELIVAPILATISFFFLNAATPTGIFSFKQLPAFISMYIMFEENLVLEDANK